jgi:MtN3 and saliva related transmembrane protein
MIHTIGYCAAFLTTVSSIPQVVAIYQTGNTSGMSPYYFSILFMGICLWLIYGILLKAKPVITANTISAITVGYILIKVLQGQ